MACVYAALLLPDSARPRLRQRDPLLALPALQGLPERPVLLALVVIYEAFASLGLKVDEGGSLGVPCNKVEIDRSVHRLWRGWPRPVLA